MRLENEGISLWYGTSDAPGPEGAVPAGGDVPITVGISPPDASNRVEVRYRINGGAVVAVPAQWFRNDSGGTAQYFLAHIPALRESDRVEYWATASCAGRYVPDSADADRAAVHFRIVDAAADASASEILLSAVLPYGRLAEVERTSAPESVGRSDAAAVPPRIVNAATDASASESLDPAMPTAARPDDVERSWPPGGVSGSDTPAVAFRVVDAPTDDFGGGDGFAFVDVTLDTPAAGLAVSAAEPGLALDLSGTIIYERLRDLRVRVRVGNMWFDATLSPGGSEDEQLWRSPVRLYHQGQIPVQAVASGRLIDIGASNERTDSSPQLILTVTLASTKPIFTILRPKPDERIPVNDTTGAEVPLEVSTSTEFGPRWISWECEGRAGEVPEGPPGLFRGSARLTGMPLGPRVISVRCRDAGGNEATESVTVTALDNTKPTLAIAEPEPYRAYVGSPSGITVTVLGTAVDLQSGMAGGAAGVGWSLNAGGPFTPASNTGADPHNPWATWTAEVPTKGFGTFTIYVRAADRDGNAEIKSVPLQVVSSYRPRDLVERLNPCNYLAALLEFARERVQLSDGSQLSAADLESVFLQPFGRLSQPLSETGDAGAGPVNPLLVVAEALREFRGAARSRVLAAHWSFDRSDVSGDQISDLSGNDNWGTIEGVVAERGPSDEQVIWFDGASRFVRVPHTASLDLGSNGADFSLSFHIWPRRGRTGRWRVVMRKGATDQERTFGIWLHPDSNRMHARITTTEDWNEGLDSVGELPVGQWTHVAYVKAGNELRLFLDGKLDRSVSLRGQSVANTGPLYIGKDPWWPGFDGLLKDLRIFGLALGSASVGSLASTGGTEVLVHSFGAGEAGYRWAAYEALLAGIGTSYEELRLARGAELPQRTALANRLGITLGTAEPDELDQLTLDPVTLTEDTLEQLFGFRDTDITKGPLRPSVQGLTLQWRETALSLRWAEADHTPEGKDRALPVLVDPDLIGLDDLAANVVNGEVEKLLAARRAEVWQIREDLRVAREGGGPGPGAQVRALLQKGLPGVDLLKLKERQAAGEDIDPMLRTLNLSWEGFEYLLRTIRVADSGSVTGTEWQDAYDILTQVEKNRRYPQWRAQEGAITLSPDQFRISEEPRSLPPWRATPRSRNQWQRLLQTRIDDREATEQAYRSLLAATDEITLPRLRDALVQSIAGAEVADDVAEWLTQRLQIDVKTSGVPRVTRIGQAIQTVQNVLFVLRTGQLPEDHPADRWTLVDEAGFDDAWRWIGTYEAWRAAMSVYLNPENILQPALRPDATEPFAQLVRMLRRRQRIGPEDARELSAAFFEAQLRGAHPRRLPTPLTHWTFGEGLGPTTGDFGDPGGSTGTVIGAQWTIGAVGASALAFDGVDDRVNVAWSPELKNVTNSFAISFWASPESRHEVDEQSVSTTSGTSGQRYAFGPVQGQTAWGAAEHAGVGVSVGTNGVSVYEHSAGYMPAVLVHNKALTGWTHIAVVYDKRRPRLYVNGSRVGSTDDTSTRVTSVHPAPDGLGGMEYGHFHGRLDDVRVYAGVLSAEQVELLAVRLSDQRTEAELDLLREHSHRLLTSQRTGSRAPPYLKPGSEWLSELFCHAPLALALALQSSGEYVAALDWYQTVYAYNLPPERRTIYHGLALERNDPPNLAPTGNWTARLNPHVIASTRPNPLTRFLLMSLARCCTEFADAEFTVDSAESVARARSLYLTARDLLAQPDLEPVIDPSSLEWPVPNPVRDSMRSRVEVQLAKLRQGRSIAGIPRVSAPPATPPPDTRVGVGATTPVSPQRTRPTPYRYRVLVERSKQLVTLAQQAEAAYLDALEKHDHASYQRFDANKGVELTEATVTLQGLRVTEAARGVSLANAQLTRARAVGQEYQRLVDAGLNEYENAMLDGYWTIKTWRDVIGVLDAWIGAGQAAQSAAASFQFPWLWAFAGATSAKFTGKAVAGAFLNAAEARLQSNSLLAGHERAVEGWRLQKSIADQDALVADQQVLLAGDQKAIVEQEQRIARIHAAQAVAAVEFLDRQFTNRELYEWMSGVLAGVYRYFLQQATALAQAAQNQLAFDRQEPLAALVSADYWESPSDGATDRRGLTGSVRLLQDLTQLDQYAFETDRRKLNLSQTFSLAARAPLEFQLFRQSGVLRFATPMRWFDEDFPGHYLRLIRRANLSVVALIPPSRGIRATLTNSGISRVVVAGDTYFEVVVRRDPETVALTSPLAATGVFDLDVQSDLLLPFEGTGVDTTWELQMPRAANPIDPDSFADVLLTIEYTALHSEDYRHQLVERFNRDLRRSGDRAFSLRQDFADQWYDLHNPADQTDSRSVRLRLEPTDYPSNIDLPKVEQLVIYMMSANGSPPVDQVDVTLTHAGQSGVARCNKANRGLISTRRGNADAWKNFGDTSAVGIWELTFSPAAGPLFDSDRLEDVLFVVGYVGEVPRWPQ